MVVGRDFVENVRFTVGVLDVVPHVIEGATGNGGERVRDVAAVDGDNNFRVATPYVGLVDGVGPRIVIAGRTIAYCYHATFYVFGRFFYRVWRYHVDFVCMCVLYKLFA